MTHRRGNESDLGRAATLARSAWSNGTARLAPNAQKHIAGLLLSPTAERLEIDDITVHIRGGRAWVSLPAKPMLDADGRQVIRDGRPQYTSIIRWRDADLARRFNEAVIALVRAEYPDALAEAGPDQMSLNL